MERRPVAFQLLRWSYLDKVLDPIPVIRDNYYSTYIVLIAKKFSTNFEKP